MANEAIITDERIGLRRISWGAIFAGAVAALASWALLYALGAAIGLSAVPNEGGGSLRASGIFTGVWGALSPLLALFLGGLVAGRASGLFGRSPGALHGFVTWGVTTIAGFYLMTSLLSSLMGGLFSAGQTVAQVGGSAVSAAAGAGGDLARSIGLKPNELRQQGKQAVSSGQLQAAREKAEASGLKAANVTAKAMWGVVFALGLGLFAALGGGILGARPQGPPRRRPRPEREPLRERPVTTTGGEVYP